MYYYFLCLQRLSKINESVCALFNEYSRLSVTKENLSDNDSLSTNLALLVLISEKILKDSCYTVSVLKIYIAIYGYVVYDVYVCAGGEWLLSQLQQYKLHLRALPQLWLGKREGKRGNKVSDKNWTNNQSG